MIETFIKFGLVGFSGVLVDFSVTWFIKEKLRIYRYIANSSGFIVAASSNWLFNRIWAFESENPQILFEYSSFLIVSIIGLGTNNGFLYFFERRMNFYMAKLLAIGITTIWNFFANYYITFNY